MKNKFTEIKNRTAYIQDLLVELEEVIKEAEIAETINTTKEGHKTFKDMQYLIGSTVNELDDYEKTDDCQTHCFAKYIGGVMVVLTLIYLLNQ